MARIGYARVSTTGQSLLIQEARLSAAGCENVFTDQASAVKSQRPGWLECLEALSAGDTLVVTSLDRAGRSLRHLLDTTSPHGRLIFSIIAAVAEFERTLILERTAAGRAEAMAAGVQFGRPRVMTPADVADAHALHQQGWALPRIAARMGVSRMTLWRYMSTDDA